MKQRRLLALTLLLALAATAAGIAVAVRSSGGPSGPGTTSGSPIHLSAQGRLLWQFEGLLRETFGSRPLCARITSASDNFSAGVCSPLALYSPYWYSFTDARRSRFHVSDKVASNFGNYPVPVLINGRSVACNWTETKFLIKYPDASSFSLACSRAGYVRPYRGQSHH